MIYLDNAATTLHKPPQVIEAVVTAMNTLGNASRGVHEGAIGASMAVHQARQEVATFFGCSRPDHVIFTQNATEALNIALWGLFSRGDHIITTEMEHNSVLRPLYALSDEEGVELSFLPVSPSGRLELTKLDALVRPGQTKAIVCTHASNLTGDAVDLTSMAATARAHDLLLVVDASQTAGVLPIDMSAMGIDVLCFTGHKSLMGPQGTGGLCIRDGVEIRPFKRGGTGVQSYLKEQPADYPTRLEAGTLNSHGIAGLLAALRFIKETGLETIHEKEIDLARAFYNGIRELDGVQVYGDHSTDHRAAIVSLNIEGLDSPEVADILATDFGIATRPGAHCAPLMHRALGTTETGAVRFSFGYFNTGEEVAAAVAAVSRIAAAVMVERQAREADDR